MSYIEKMQAILTAHANDENAFHMEKYMRNQFMFLGIKTPLRKNLTQQFFKETKIKEEDFQPEFVRSLWQSIEREYQYVAMDHIGLSLKKLRKEDLFLLEELITTKSWWDTADMLAQKAVGKIASDHPEVISEIIEEWNKSENMWLQRSALLFQLKYKEHTDEKLLYRFINDHASSKEFFIQKAIGWVLREYSKTNPDSVKQFISRNQLAKLSVREGSKYLTK
ncbi:DNA alkylation repair protein [Oceanobacillus sp. FSL H7-0719]|uniref:DNA alkylation repair protein n=1 Tax=Oceanobacillus sp. FSL H7-0719 TaxID=2954507 RepID=UPI0032454BAD